MYCSSCGTVTAQGLAYCNHCGTKLGVATDNGATKSAEISPTSLVWAMVAVFIIGLGSIIGLVAVMKTVLGSNDGLINAAMLFSFLLLLAIEGVFMWLLLSRRNSAKVSGDIKQIKEQPAEVLSAAEARRLAEPVPSVTEHTTRSFEPIYRERKVE